jgi:hypothetical protein
MQPRRLIPLLTLAASPLLASAAALAQTPFVPLADIWVTDSTNDRIARVRDLDFDGDYNDAGEVDVFYDDTLGAFALSNNVNISSRADGTLWVTDTSADQILRFVDLDGDGAAHGVNEATLYFDAVLNASGIAMPSPQGMFWQGSVLWVANAQSGSSGKDTILRLEDLNGDDDALDAGEASEYFVSVDLALGGASNDSIPQDVHVGLDGALYYVDIGTTGLYPKGIYRLVDSDGSGAIDQPGELTQFFIPPAQAAQAFFWNLTQDSNGYWYLADTGNDFIWRARDDNGDSLIDPSTEAKKFWIAPSSSTVWDLNVGADGLLYVGESQNNERFFTMRDADGDDSIDPLSEVTTVYDELATLGAPIGQLRGWCFDAKQQAPAKTYCTAQVNTLGCSASYSFAGWPSASQPSGFLLSVSNLRNQKNGVPFYGLAGPASAPFHGGTLCAQPPLRRIAVLYSGGSPSGDDCTGSVTYDFNARIALGLDPGLLLGAVVHTQHWSRDPGAPPSNTNLSNALEFCILR